MAAADDLDVTEWQFNPKGATLLSLPRFQGFEEQCRREKTAIIKRLHVAPHMVQRYDAYNACAHTLATAPPQATKRRHARASRAPERLLQSAVAHSVAGWAQTVKP